MIRLLFFKIEVFSIKGSYRNEETNGSRRLKEPLLKFYF